MADKKYNRKHLTTTQRIKIEFGLNKGLSMAAIAREIEKDPTTVGKEVKKYRTFQPKDTEQLPLKCARFKECSMRFLCDKKDCVKLCKTCFDESSDYRQLKCTTLCSDYLESQCDTLQRSPYVCNACPKVKRCNKTKAFYIAQNADRSSRELLVSCRAGINQEPADIALLDNLISPLLKQGQSLAHIYAFHGHEIPCCRKTLYNYIDQGVFSARNIDMRRRVRYKCKPRKKGTRVSLAAKEFRIGRTYEDFQRHLAENPGISVVEMDTVEGGKDNSTQVFLTLLFRNCRLMLIFVLAEKTQACVTEVFDILSERLGVSVFRELFPVILTDNGTEFQFPPRLECDAMGVGISVMKAFGGGKLLKAETSPLKHALTEYQCLQYALDKPGVLTTLPGVRNREDLKRVLGFLTAAPEEKDYSVLGTLAPQDAKGVCVYCNHCQPCPAGLNVGLINKYYDLSCVGDVMAKDHYLQLSKHAEDCVGCGHCNSTCPFHVDQVQRMQEIKGYFGK